MKYVGNYINQLRVYPESTPRDVVWASSLLCPSSDLSTGSHYGMSALPNIKEKEDNEKELEMKSDPFVICI